MRLLSVLPLIALIWLMPPGPAQADIRALLVGVSDYTDASGIPDLRGPKNDVALLRDVFEKRKVQDIHILADGVEGAMRPTRKAIGDAFAALPEGMGEGDLVIIYMSGHGTQQVDENGDETDGLDEVFLPADAAKAEGGAVTIPNALADDAIGAAVEAVRATGADVWLIMDSCHSGSGVRDTSPRTAPRQVDPSVLGLDIERKAIEATVIDQPATATRSTGDDLKGGYLAYYATRSSDVAREIDFGDGEWYGLFTATLAARLESSPTLSYRQLFQGVLSDMNSSATLGSAALQTPQWEGTIADAPVFGGGDLTGLRRFIVEGDQIEAGLAHQMQNGTLVALVADISDPADAVLGYAQLEDIEARRAYLRPVAADCEPHSDTLCPYDGTLPADANFAQLEAQPRNEVIRFSPPLHPETGEALSVDDPITARLSAALEMASEMASIASRIDPAAYDVQVIYEGGTYWFGPEARVGSYPAGPSSEAQTAEGLSPLVMRILRAETLARTLSRLEGSGGLMNPMPLEFDVTLLPSDPQDLNPPGSPINPRRECSRAIANAGQTKARPLQPGDDVKQCDQLGFAAQGVQSGAREVNRIWIDAHYCINTRYALIEGDRAASPVGDGIFICSDCPGEPSYSAGTERLFFLVSEVEENTESLNLTGLLENCVGERSVGSRSAARNELMQTLKVVGDAGSTRGGMSSSGTLSSVWVESHRWRVIPRKMVFERNGR